MSGESKPIPETRLSRAITHVLQPNIDAFDAAVERHGGLVGAFQEAVALIGGKVESLYDSPEETIKILSEGGGPVIVIAEHPNTMSGQPALLAALPDRKGTYAIGASVMGLGFGDAAKEFFYLHMLLISTVKKNLSV